MSLNKTPENQQSNESSFLKTWLQRIGIGTLLAIAPACAASQAEKRAPELTAVQEATKIMNYKGEKLVEYHVDDPKNARITGIKKVVEALKITFSKFRKKYDFQIIDQGSGRFWITFTEKKTERQVTKKRNPSKKEAPKERVLSEETVKRLDYLEIFADGLLTLFEETRKKYETHSEFSLFQLNVLQKGLDIKDEANGLMLGTVKPPKLKLKKGETIENLAKEEAKKFIKNVIEKAGLLEPDLFEGITDGLIDPEESQEAEEPLSPDDYDPILLD